MIHASRLALMIFSTLSLSSLPAFAQNERPLSINLTGIFSGYVVYHSQDNSTGNEERHIDIMREASIFTNAEGTLDNGLTVGYFLESLIDMGDSFNVSDSYIYFSNSWGRINFGGTDGAAALLQIAAPAADPLFDGMEQLINPVNHQLMLGLGAPVNVAMGYLMGQSGAEDKITYLTPSFNGLQAGISYTPEMNSIASRSLGGVLADDTEEDSGSVWEGSVRYEGRFEEATLTMGAGYSHIDLEKDVTGAGTDTFDDRRAWDLGVNVKYKGYGAGIAYVTDDNGLRDSDTDILVIGADYTTGPWRIGASYYDREDDIENLGLGNIDIETQRYSAGVTYTAGGGLSLKGSAHHIEHDIAGSDDPDATTFVLGSTLTF
ncbi:MAG: porin [Micavibrio aeruginosavorus]|uniref:Porin n=1 Tax=Micavibrio aeruginosavorus TaxID=349221 RepID=A0A7T5UGY6_9BACT|nr:MAG: porin [Micavibrio aeruginosavorus]